MLKVEAQHYLFVDIVINFFPMTLLFFFHKKYNYLEKIVI